MFPLNPSRTRVFATAMKLADVVEIKEAPSQALPGGVDLLTISDEVKYI